MSIILECEKHNTISFNNDKNEINLCTFNNSELIPNIYEQKNNFEKLKELQILFQKYSYLKELCI